MYDLGQLLGQLAILGVFISAAVSAAPPITREVVARCEAARALAIVTAHMRFFPACHGISVKPSGRLSSNLESPVGSLVDGIPAC